MYFLFLSASPLSREEYLTLKAKRDEITTQISALRNALHATDDRFRTLEEIYNPHINIVEVNNKTMGHRFIGRYVIENLVGERNRFTVSIGKVEDFKGKDDPRIMEIAREKVVEQLQKKYPHAFIEKSL
jgi:hypothetical protein